MNNGMNNNMGGNNPNTNASGIDIDRIFGTAGKVLDTSKNVYDAISNGFDGSRRNIGAGPGSYQSQQQSYPSYGYGYYDDNSGMSMNANMYYQQNQQQQMMSDYYPGISNPTYGKGGY